MIDFSEPPTPYNAYVEALKGAGLAQSALGRDWIRAGERALAAATPVVLPIEESGYWPDAEPQAVAFRVALERGRKLLLTTTLTPPGNARLFIDIFRLPEDELDSLRHVVSADSNATSLEFEPRRTGDYLIRIQPELLRGGRYALSVRAEPALSFPVHGRGNSAIQSGFGAPRDGGARDHHGIDIFAPRGTPVLAAAQGYVTRVNETTRGGRVVWQRDEKRGISIYYAHLDEQLVEPGQSVSIGDTIGLVGNTGNARTTAPHLHFGVYQRGPLDPRPWVARISATAEPLQADTSLLGAWARSTRVVTLRSAWKSEENSVARLPKHTVMRVLSGSGPSLRVALPTGTIGYVDGAALEALTPIRALIARGAVEVVAKPEPGAALIDAKPAELLTVLGRFQDYLMVRVDSITGWVLDRSTI